MNLRRESTMAIGLTLFAALAFMVFHDVQHNAQPKRRADSTAIQTDTSAAVVASDSGGPREVDGASRSPATHAFVEPLGPLKDNLDNVERKALSGDDAAAYFLGSRLFECRLGNPLARGNQDAPMTAENGEFCAGLTAVDLDSFKQWLQLAADRGNVDAQTAYATLAGGTFSTSDAIRDPSAIEDYKRHSIDYLNRASRQGSAAALAQLSSLYERGIVAPKNLELAYAYDLAFQQVLGGTQMDSSERLAQNLTKGEVQRARMLARKLASPISHN